MDGLRQQLADFQADHGRAPTIVIHPDDWEDLCGWFGSGTGALSTSRSGLTMGAARVYRSRDVERGRPELL